VTLKQWLKELKVTAKGRPVYSFEWFVDSLFSYQVVKPIGADKKHRLVEADSALMEASRKPRKRTSRKREARETTKSANGKKAAARPPKKRS